MVISNRASTSAPDPVAHTTSDSPRSHTDESALGHIMEIICGGGFPLDEEPIQAPLVNALASRLAPPPVAQSTSNLIQLDTDPNDLPVDPEILKIDPASYPIRSYSAGLLTSTWYLGPVRIEDAEAKQETSII